MTRPIATTGSQSRPASRDARNTRHDSIYDGMQSRLTPLPSGSISSPVAIFKQLDAAQSILDGLALVALFLIGCVIALSIPLAVFLLLVAKFH